MELGPGEKIIDGELYYSAAFLDSYQYAGRSIITAPDYKLTGTLTTRHVLNDDGVWKIEYYDIPARRSVRHARLIEAWATCYCMVLALPRVPRACGRGIRWVFDHELFWWVVGAIVAAVATGVIIGFLLPA